MRKGGREAGRERNGQRRNKSEGRVGVRRKGSL